MLNTNDLDELLTALAALPHETEWVEFKRSRAEPEEIGEYLSAISNSAALLNKEAGYIVWGLSDQAHTIVGTQFKPRREKVGNQELEIWLALHLSPRIDFSIYEWAHQGLNITLFRVQPAVHTPVRWKDTEHIRVGSNKKKLKEFPEKERALWLQLSRQPFELGTALDNCSEDDVLRLINYPDYFRLMEQTLPSDRKGILGRLVSENIIISGSRNRYDITNLGAILFAYRLSDFSRLDRKAVRVIAYDGFNRVSGGREHKDDAGYAVGFEALIRLINERLPFNEVMGPALRKELRMYPTAAIRELVANAIIHQDLTVTGESPLIEVFTDRVEITNPGQSLIAPLRVIDEPPRSRNETLAAFMRRLNICEERGSGWDKIITTVEAYQLPPPDFRVKESHTQVVLFAYRKLSSMDAAERMRACYQHACLQYVSNENMTNTSLRKRFGIEDQNYSAASRIIADTLRAGLIKPYDPENISKKLARYVPFWA
jgi:ATP-dependent DNA helicase RecG